MDEAKARAMRKTLAPGSGMALVVAVLVGVFALGFIGVGVYWSSEPARFDVRENAARFAASQNRQLVVGSVTVATLVRLSLIHISEPTRPY